MSHEGHLAAADVVASSDGRVLGQLTWLGLILGAAGLAAAIAFSAGDAKQFYSSWLVAYLFWLSIPLGALFFVLCLFVCRAGWGVALRRVVENAMATMPLFALLFIPIWLGRHEIYA
ncbi:MAG: hypothetical protein ACREQ9_23205, partial [Candidatus Binatia bacterium]